MMIRVVDKVSGRRQRIDTIGAFQQCADYLLTREYYVRAGEEFTINRETISTQQYEKMEPAEQAQFIRVEKARPDLILATNGTRAETFVRDCLKNNYRYGYEYREGDKRLADHNIISFHPRDNVSPEKAFQIGCEFAEKVFHDYQTLVVVHVDHENKGTIHAHILHNNVSCRAPYFKDGKCYRERVHKYQDGNNAKKFYGGYSLAQQKELLDKIQEREHLRWSRMTEKEIIREEQKIAKEETRQIFINSPVQERIQMIREKIDRALENRNVLNMKTFVAELKKEGLDLKQNDRNFYFTSDREDKSIRAESSRNIDRNGKETLHQYSRVAIMERLEKNCRERELELLKKIERELKREMTKEQVAKLVSLKDEILKIRSYRDNNFVNESEEKRIQDKISEIENCQAKMKEHEIKVDISSALKPARSHSQNQNQTRSRGKNVNNDNDNDRGSGVRPSDNRG